MRSAILFALSNLTPLLTLRGCGLIPSGSLAVMLRPSPSSLLEVGLPAALGVESLLSFPVLPCLLGLAAVMPWLAVSCFRGPAIPATVRPIGLRGGTSSGREDMSCSH